MSTPSLSGSLSSSLSSFVKWHGASLLCCIILGGYWTSRSTWGQATQFQLGENGMRLSEYETQLKKEIEDRKQTSEVNDRVIRSIFRIEVTRGNELTKGLGTIVSPGKFMLTSASLVEKANKVRAFDMNETAREVEGALIVDLVTDIAILKMRDSLTDSLAIRNEKSLDIRKPFRLFQKIKASDSANMQFPNIPTAMRAQYAKGFDDRFINLKIQRTFVPDEIRNLPNSKYYSGAWLGSLGALSDRELGAPIVDIQGELISVIGRTARSPEKYLPGPKNVAMLLQAAHKRTPGLFEPTSIDESVDEPSPVVKKPLADIVREPTKEAIDVFLNKCRKIPQERPEVIRKKKSEEEKYLQQVQRSVVFSPDQAGFPQAPFYENETERNKGLSHFQKQIDLIDDLLSNPAELISEEAITSMIRYIGPEFNARKAKEIGWISELKYVQIVSDELAVVEVEGLPFLYLHPVDRRLVSGSRGNAKTVLVSGIAPLNLGDSVPFNLTVLVDVPHKRLGKVYEGGCLFPRSIASLKEERQRKSTKGFENAGPRRSEDFLDDFINLHNSLASPLKSSNHSFGELSFPRKWKDRSGKFEVLASCRELNNTEVKLLILRENREITVPINKLSDEDQAFLQNFKK